VTLSGVVVLSLAGRMDPRDSASAPLWMNLAVDGVGKGVALAAVLALHAVLSRGEKGRPARPGGAVLAGLLAGLAFLPIMLGISWAQSAAYEAAGIPMEGQALVVQAAREDAFTLSLVAFFAVVAAPLFEETLFRGFLFGGLRRWAGPWTAAILSAALFAGYHLEVEVLPVTFALGLVAAWLRERTGGLLAPIAMHACYNAVQVAGIVSARGG
jgi:membrane protease YdiL (CAAX protease family)